MCYLDAMIGRIGNNDRVIRTDGDASWPCERSLVAATDAELQLYASFLHVGITWHVGRHADAADAPTDGVLLSVLRVLDAAFAALPLLLVLLLLLRLGVVRVLGVAVFIALAVLVFKVSRPGAEWRLAGAIISRIRMSRCVWRRGSSGIPDFPSVPAHFRIGGNFVRALAAGKPGSIKIQFKSVQIDFWLRFGMDRYGLKSSHFKETRFCDLFDHKVRLG